MLHFTMPQHKTPNTSLFHSNSCSCSNGEGGGGTHKLCWLNREGRLDNEMCCDQRYYGLSTGHMCIDGTERIDMFAMHR